MNDYYRMLFGIPIPGIQIVVDPYMPGPVQIKHATKGPYRRRREKKLANDPKNWAMPKIVKVGNAYYCHPWALAVLKLALNSGRSPLP